MSKPWLIGNMHARIYIHISIFSVLINKIPAVSFWIICISLDNLKSHCHLDNIPFEFIFIRIVLVSMD